LTMPGQAGAMKNVKWHKRVTKRNDAGEEEEIETLVIAEDEMGAFEKRILQLWPEISDDFDCITPGGHRQEMHIGKLQKAKRRSLTAPIRKGSKGLPAPQTNGARAETLPPMPKVEFHHDYTVANGNSSEGGRPESGSTEDGLKPERPHAARRLSLDTRSVRNRSRGSSIGGEDYVPEPNTAGTI
jgi:hypothetical protein